MIFITVGSQKFQFNRLLKAVDRLVENKKITEDVFAQIGYSDYKPKNYEYKEFLDRNEFEIMISKCDILITHGGTGAIINGLKRDKKVIAVPRLKEYGEHVDNHQLQIIHEFEEMNFISAVYDLKDLEDYINNIKCKEFNKYESNTINIINSIDRFIESN
ncbi:PssE/Cps14G family polysaccharide biosynthesis glycosyltransferase [uncultured Clostridium sp.]|uniref:PssE/Cps14G family polysaccharide biosynthesis glycosyltransferase n=1 Tax=uncultured Clostridium sp. TaxID=59620 RepID=UPI0025E32DD4|nr:PssE/Cps14G family polysaccharide biosynthesis glycosyltransferase [uncultured Clostridium sp.]